MKTAIIYKAHICSDTLKQEYEKLRNDCKSSEHYFESYLLFDQTSNSVDGYSFENFELFTTADISNLSYKFKSLMYNWDYPILYFYRKYPDFNFYWVIDYDVRFTGNWNEFLSYYVELEDYDLITSYVANYNPDKVWAHWGRANIEFPIEEMRKVFYSVARFSNKALRILDSSYSSKMFGFCEYIGPSILAKNNCKIGDFSGSGKYKIPGKPRSFCNSKTFRYRPDFAEVGAEPDMLYHPIKKL